jgi:adenylate cyclase
MAEERVLRRLAAILVADVVGYSRLMEEDEAATMVALGDRRKAIWEPLLAKYRGRVIRTKGDSTLAEFASAVDAVQCAVDVQKAMKEANTKVSDDRAIILRIGLNLGDVMVQDGDLYGDGVNVAARLEAMADSGGIFLSAAIHQQVERLLPIAFRDLGHQALKNIARPVRVYCIADDDEVAAYARRTETARAFSVPRKPSVAVLPLRNMSGDPAQQYFSDGITEDIITELSRFHALVVIARNSSFQYRENAIDVKRVGRELGVQYVVEGSIRRAGGHIRISAQLVDATTGGHVWAQRYDRDLPDVFAIQDELTTAIVATVAGHVQAAGINKVRRMRTDSMAAYDLFLRGLEHFNRAGSEDTIPARQLFERAIDVDPDFAQAHALRAASLVETYWDENFRGRNTVTLDHALRAAQRAVTLDDNDAQCHCVLAYVHMARRSFDLSLLHLDRATKLNPSDADSIVYRAILEVFTGRAKDALHSWGGDAVKSGPPELVPRD